MTTKVLLFCKFPPPYTGQTIAAKIVRNFLTGHVKVATLDTGFGRFRPDRFGLGWVHYHLGYSLYLVGCYYRMYRKVKRENIATLYIVASASIAGAMRNYLTVLIARSHVEDIVAHVHNGNYTDLFSRPGQSWLGRRLVDAIDRFIFLSTGLSERASDNIPAAKRRVVPNAIDVRVQCDREEVEAKISQPRADRPFRILYLGNMIRTKGYRDVVRALAHLVQDGNENLVLDLVGEWIEPDSRDWLQNYVRKANGLKQYMRVHGPVTDRSRIKDFHLDSDVSVLPTYYPGEAQPLSMIEALCAGTPVVATTHASIPEYIDDGVNGFLVESHSPLEIADQIAQLQADATLWRSMSREARRTYDHYFSDHVVATRLRRVVGA